MGVDWLSVADVANNVLEVMILFGLAMIGALAAWFYGLDAYRDHRRRRYVRHIERSEHPTNLVRLVPRSRVFDWAAEEDGGAA